MFTLKCLGIYIVILLNYTYCLHAQKKTYSITSVAFYNLENLFDCENDPLLFDGDYTPKGRNQWTEDRLEFKLDRLAEVISKIGVKTAINPPALLGVAEIENKSVLERLVDHALLQQSDYGIAHYNSPDRRGIDVALLYNRQVFTLTNTQKHRLYLYDEFKQPIYSRDQLCVSGYLGDELVYCIVNHWPSRRGGQKRSEPRRIEAAELCKKIIDSIYNVTPKASIIVMGDFNDDPTNNSFKKILKTKSNISKKDPRYLYNPMEKMHRQGIGSLAYRDEWNLFDQIIVSNALLDTIGFKLYKTHVFNPKFLIHTKGTYKGYPFRTYSRGIYSGGYSDHFPVYMFLIKSIALPKN